MAVLTDVVLLWALWPAVLAGRSRLEWPRLSRISVLATSLVSFVPIWLVFVVATFPSEWVDGAIPELKIIPSKSALRHIFARTPSAGEEMTKTNQTDGGAGSELPSSKESWTSVHRLLFNGEFDDKGQLRESIFSNTLDV